jgi:hypothetical protein
MATKKSLVSDRFTLSSPQVQAIFKSLWKYSLPLVLVFLLELQKGTPVKQALPILYGAGLQLAINFLSKYLTETK